MANLAQIYDWFMTGKKPTQAQFWASWGSFWNKEETIPQSAISNLTTVLNAKTENDQFNAHKVAGDAHADLFTGKEDKSQKGAAGGYVPLNEFTKIANEFLTIVNDLVTGGATSILSAEQGVVLQTQITAINTILTSDDINLDTIQELVDAIKTVETSLETILVNDLTTGGTTKALTAEMGKQLKILIDNISSEISIQNKEGVEQFKVTDLIKFESVSFNAAQKMISIDSLVPLSAFLDTVNGNDSTGTIENSKKPFKTIESLFTALPTFNGETYTIYIIGSVVNVLKQLPARNIRWVSYTGTTLDFTNCTNIDNSPSNFALLNVGGTSTKTWEFTNRNISLICNYIGRRSFSSNTDQNYLNIQGVINTLNWKSVSDSASRGVFFVQQGSEFSIVNVYDSPQTNTIFGTELLTIETNITIENLYIEFGRTLTNKYFGTINIKKLIHLGTGSLNWTMHYSPGGASFIKQSLKLINFRGKITPSCGLLTFDNCSVNDEASFDLIRCGTITGSVTSLNYLTNTYMNNTQVYKNFTGKLNGLGIFEMGYVIFENCIIESNDRLIKRFTGSGGASNREDVIYTYGFNVFNLISTTSDLLYSMLGVAGKLIILNNFGTIKTNASSYGLNVNCIERASTFKEKLNELVIRSKKDIVNRVLSSETNYIIDGIINDIIATDRIIVPVGGLSLSGYGFDVSALKATQSNSILFESAVGGCGNLFLSNISLEASGVGSKVFNLTNAGAPTGGADAIELNVVNFDNCTSLGELTNFRQGLWNNIGVFGCKDGLTLSGTWSGGFRSGLVIVRNFGVDSTVSTLFKKGTALFMESRFLTDINADFKVGGLLSNFDTSNFSSNRLYQIKGAILTRNKVIDSTDNFTDTLNVNSSVSDWFGNIGLPNAGQVAYTDIEVNDPTKGFVLTSPDGNKFRMTVSDAGVTTVTAI